jgi:hypothetical protein
MMDTTLISREPATASGSILELTAAELPRQLPVGLLGQAVFREIRVREPIGAGAGILHFLRFLREAASHGITVAWEQAGDLGCDPVLLYHLPPPAADPVWRAAYRYGLCHYRVGPGFLVVTDRRRGPAPTPQVLRDAAEVELLRKLDAPGPVDRSSAFDRLLGQGLLATYGSEALTLPYRLRRWPIPCTAI